VKAREVEGLDPDGPLRPNVTRIVATRLGELRSFADSALVPEASEEQHDMRIAAKRLRYVLELFGPCLGDEAEEARQVAKRLQSVLGDLHDCDLMLGKVEGIGSVESVLRERRGRLYREFVELWQSQEVHL
jgi:CHAD domain-containing protein